MLTLADVANLAEIAIAWLGASDRFSYLKAAATPLLSLTSGGVGALLGAWATLKAARESHNRAMLASEAARRAGLREDAYLNFLDWHDKHRFDSRTPTVTFPSGALLVRLSLFGSDTLRRAAQQLDALLTTAHPQEPQSRSPLRQNRALVLAELMEHVIRSELLGSDKESHNTKQARRLEQATRDVRQLRYAWELDDWGLSDGPSCDESPT